MATQLSSLFRTFAVFLFRRNSAAVGNLKIELKFENRVEIWKSNWNLKIKSCTWHLHVTFWLCWFLWLFTERTHFSQRMLNVWRCEGVNAWIFESGNMWMCEYVEGVNMWMREYVNLGICECVNMWMRECQCVCVCEWQLTHEFHWIRECQRMCECHECVNPVSAKSLETLSGWTENKFQKWKYKIWEAVSSFQDRIICAESPDTGLVLNYAWFSF
jgi:hypothetical protein